MDLQIPVMTHDWVNAVWKESLKENIFARDKKFDIYKCPPFYDLKVSVTGFNNREIEQIKRLVTKHGNIFYIFYLIVSFIVYFHLGRVIAIKFSGGSFEPNFTASEHILVVKKTSGEKFRYAKTWSVPCVEPRWIFDCVESGYALPTKSYEVGTSMTTSSPTSERDPASKLNDTKFKFRCFKHAVYHLM